MKRTIFFIAILLGIVQVKAQEIPIEHAKAKEILKSLAPDQGYQLKEQYQKEIKNAKKVEKTSKIREQTILEQENISNEIAHNVKHKEASPIFGYDFFRKSKVSFAPSPNMPTPEGYIIGTGDELLVEVWGASENTITEKVDNQGNINIPLVGKIHLSGLTFSQAKERIKSALKRIYAGISAPEGSLEKVYTGVSLSNIRTIRVNIIGEVISPGTYSVSALSTVLNALYACGGPNASGSFRNVKLIRNGREISVFDIYDFLLTGSQKGNLNINDQDVILVPSYENRVQVKGQVKRQGIYEMRKDETLSDLVQFFGGFTPNAYKDNIIVERVQGAKRKVQEVTAEQIKTFVMQNGDFITIHELSNIYHNRISIGGSVYQPGNYAYTQGMSALDLIQKAAGLRADAYLQRGLIFRSDITPSVIEFSVNDLLSKKKNIALQVGDSLHIFNHSQIENAFIVTIDGAVKHPMKTIYRKGMKVEDLILMAGGFKEGADSSTIQVGRQTNDQNYKQISALFDVSVAPDLKISEQSIELEPNDIVTIRYKKGFVKQKIVSVQGEVAMAGHYVISNQEERISDLVERAGGVTPYAYLKGATLIRRKSVHQTEQEKQVNALKENDVISLDENRVALRVGIHLEQILKNKGSYQDLILKEGDILIIPSEKQTVLVKGEVLSEVMVRYQKGKSVRSYINSAGGFSNKAKKRSVYVVYSNGDVKGTKRFLWINNYPKVEPGAIVIVPEREQRPAISLGEAIGITTSITTLGVLIFNIFK